MRTDERARLEAEIEAEIAAWRAGPRAGLHRALLLASMAAALCLLVGSRAEWIEALARGEIELSGAPRYVPAHPVDPAALARIDFEQLHAHAIPDWIELLASARGAADRRRAEDAFRVLRATVAPDPNLAAIWDELHERLAGSALQHARRVDWLLWAHDQYLERVGQPYRLEASVHLRGSGARRRAVITVMTYRVVSDLRAGAGERVRVLRRVDRTRVVEGWLGHTARDADGAIVVADRVLHFTVRHVWPALDAALDGRRPSAERGVLEGVREEVEAAIAPGHLEVLRETAADEQALIEIAESIRARHACGSRFEVFDLPYKGLSIASHRALRSALWASQWSRCPDVTVDEAARLIGASERLRATEGLDPALEALAALVARSVAAHELRHAGDGDDDALACVGCAEGTPPLVRAELSAYLAAFATRGLGYVAALQACAIPQRTPGHALAVTIATEAAIPGGCSGDAGVGLYARAERAERRYFGARPAVAVPDAFPRTLEVLPRARPAVAERRTR